MTSQAKIPMSIRLSLSQRMWAWMIPFGDQKVKPTCCILLAHIHNTNDHHDPSYLISNLNHGLWITKRKFSFSTRLLTPKQRFPQLLTSILISCSWSPLMLSSVLWLRPYPTPDNHPLIQKPSCWPTFYPFYSLFSYSYAIEALLSQNLGTYWHPKLTIFFPRFRIPIRELNDAIP